MAIIKIRRDVLSNWNNSSYLLAEGEIGIATDQSPLEIRVGTGTKTWSNLPASYWTNFKGIKVNGVVASVDSNGYIIVPTGSGGSGNISGTGTVGKLAQWSGSTTGLGNGPNVSSASSDVVSGNNSTLVTAGAVCDYVESLLNPFSISSFTVKPTMLETGTTRTTIGFTGSFSRTPSNWSITSSREGGILSDGSPSGTSFTKSVLANFDGSSTTTFTLKAVSGTTTKTTTNTIGFGYYRFYKTLSSGEDGNSILVALQGSSAAGNRTVLLSNEYSTSFVNSISINLSGYCGFVLLLPSGVSFNKATSSDGLDVITTNDDIHVLDGSIAVNDSNGNSLSYTAYYLQSAVPYTKTYIITLN